MPVTIDRYKLSYPQTELDDLIGRLKRTRWPGTVPGTGWSRGIDLDYMKEFVDYWINEYDWRKHETRLNELPHFKADVDGLGIHFIHVKGKGPNPMPLFMMHGYPWSFLLLLRILPLLTDPESHAVSYTHLTLPTIYSV